MKFAVFSEYLSRLESTSKRLEITDILAELIKKLSAEEIDKAMYLSLGMLGPLFANIEFAIAEKMMIRVLAKAYNHKANEVTKLYEKAGDLGNVAEGLAHKHKISNEGLSISDVYEALTEIAKYQGTGSQEKKVSKFAELFTKLDPLSARYIARIPTGNLRLGFSEITIIEALSWTQHKDKQLKKGIESYYHIYPDIGRLAKVFKSDGLKGLKEITLEVGVPLLPQLCQRVATAEEAIEKLGGFVASEFKYDGTRVQLHMDKSRSVEIPEDQLSLFANNKKMPFIKTFTRNLEETTHMFPDLINAALEQIDAKSVIIDGEAVGLDPKTGKLIPFQETSQRKRKHGVAEKINEIPLRFFVFDLLYLNGKVLLSEPLAKRRELLKSIIKKSGMIEISKQEVIKSPEKLLSAFKKARNAGLEGLVLKRPDCLYEAGGRGYNWVKFKREETGGLEDTIDGVILGYYYGRGDRARFGIGGFLVGIYDKENDGYLTVTKVGSGPTEAEWEEIKKRADKIKVKEKPANYDVTKTLLCNVWAKPEIVVVIRADELTISDVHTAGYALRFPRLMQFREDKRPEDSTTLTEIKELYKLQGGKNH